MNNFQITSWHLQNDPGITVNCSYNTATPLYIPTEALEFREFWEIAWGMNSS